MHHYYHLSLYYHYALFRELWVSDLIWICLNNLWILFSISIPCYLLLLRKMCCLLDGIYYELLSRCCGGLSLGLVARYLGPRVLSCRGHRGNYLGLDFWTDASLCCWHCRNDLPSFLTGLEAASSSTYPNPTKDNGCLSFHKPVCSEMVTDWCRELTRKVFEYYWPWCHQYWVL